MEVSITGAKIYYVIPGINYPITQTVVNAWIAMVVIVGLCIWLTRGMQVQFVDNAFGERIRQLQIRRVRSARRQNSRKRMLSDKRRSCYCAESIEF